MKNYQSNEPCVACGETNLQRTYHHVKTRKSGGTDDPENLMSLDFKHHTEVHKIGLNSFAEKYPNVRNWLIDNDWEKCELTGKWFRGK